MTTTTKPKWAFRLMLMVDALALIWLRPDSRRMPAANVDAGRIVDLKVFPIEIAAVEHCLDDTAPPPYR